MFEIHKRIVTDEKARPIAVQIDYQDWLKIKEALRLIDAAQPAADASLFAGTLKWGEDGVAYQRRIREEWSR